MAIEYDEKGKYFTDVVTKKAIPTTIQTRSGRIHGHVHVKADSRLLDELNQPEPFLAVTDASFLDEQGSVVLSCRFVTVNRREIIWLIPDEDLITK